MSNPKIIVTGGCGYIGSHTIVDLSENGFEVISIDSLVRADARMLSGIEKILGKKIRNYPVDLTDREATLAVLEEHRDAVGIIHFAAYKSVPESTEYPLLYYRNNMGALYNILEGAALYNIPNIVFSSSCSVYGLVEHLPVTEQTPFGEAQCAYARSKQHGEQVIEDFILANPLSAILLRYFNPVGAHLSSEIGETPLDVPNNLVPYITQTAAGRREKLTVFGVDYDTRDGSCIRDYVHVCDIAHAHTLAVKYLLDGTSGKALDIFNLGTGTGVSVLEAVQAFERVTGQQLKYESGPRRPGDVVAVYADNTKAREVLKWEPQYNIDEMMRSAWAWEKAMKARGYY